MLPGMIDVNNINKALKNIMCAMLCPVTRIIRFLTASIPSTSNIRSMSMVNVYATIRVITGRFIKGFNVVPENALATAVRGLTVYRGCRIAYSAAEVGCMTVDTVNLGVGVDKIG